MSNLNTILYTSARNKVYSLYRLTVEKGRSVELKFVRKLSEDKGIAMGKAMEHNRFSSEIPMVHLKDFSYEEKKMPKWKQQALEIIRLGYLPNGKYVGWKFDEVPEKYVRYWIERSDSLSSVRLEVQKIFQARAKREHLYEKWNTEDADKQAAHQDRVSQMTYVGTVGESSEFFLRVDKVHSYDTQFGAMFINICADRDGNQIVYRGTKKWEEGLYYVVDATVKKHDVFRDAPQTLISRPLVRMMIDKNGDKV